MSPPGLVRSHAVELQCQVTVVWDAPATAVHDTKAVLSGSQTLVRGQPVISYRLGVVLCYTIPTGVYMHATKADLRISVALVRGQPVVPYCLPVVLRYALAMCVRGSSVVLSGSVSLVCGQPVIAYRLFVVLRDAPATATAL